MAAWLVVVAVLLLAFFLFVVVWGQYHIFNQPSAPSGVVGPLPFGYSCKGASCAAGLICDPATTLCKVEPGQPCSQYGDCGTGFYCSGVCVSGSHGGLNQSCPCNSGLVCSPNPLQPSDLICPGPQGFPCQVNQQCVSNLCLNGFCSSGLPGGSPCLSSSQCGAGLVCDGLGYCQAPGVTSGNLGAACFPNQPPPPGGTFAGCDVGTACVEGICAIANNGLGTSCSATIACVAPFVCTNSLNGLPCQSGTAAQACTCIYPKDSNSCQTGVCSPSFTCVKGLCQGQTGQSCLVSSQCTTGKCGKLSSVYYLTQVGVGSTAVQWLPHSTLPSNVNRIVGYSQGITEVLYAICDDGLYLYSGTSWVQTIPIPWVTSFSTRVLVDIFPSAAMTLVVFLETSGGSTDYTVYISRGSGLYDPYNAMIDGNHLLGAQFSGPGAALTISRISLSPYGYATIQTLEGNIYYRSTANPLAQYYSQATYTQGNQVTTRPITGVSQGMYYQGSATFAPYDLTFIAPSTQGQVLQFNGDVSGAQYPLEAGRSYVTSAYSLYSPGIDAQSAVILLVARDINLGLSSLYLVSRGLEFQLPGIVDARSWPLVTGNRIYYSSPGTCV